MMLPAGLAWAEGLDLREPSWRARVVQLLQDHYVTDKSQGFRLSYPEGVLQWCISDVPSYRPDWCVGIVQPLGLALIGFICALPSTICVNKQHMSMPEVNFLCVHSSFRGCGLAPQLRQELSRRIKDTQKDAQVAIFTSAALISQPLASCKYYHRPLNVRKLVNSGFWSVPCSGKARLSALCKLYRPPQLDPSNPFRSVQPEDAARVAQLLNSELSRTCRVSKVYTEDDARHWLQFQTGVVQTYVVGDAHNITDIVSFYCLPTLAPGGQVIWGAYIWVAVATTMPVSKLVGAAMGFAAAGGMDVINALDVARHSECFQELKFVPGNGVSHVYLDSASLDASHVEHMPSKDVGLVLV